MLSRAQAELFISRLQQEDSNNSFSIVVRDTAGDLNQQQLLQDMDGKDFFTKDIQDFLLTGQADLAVHSLKDVSSELFFKDSVHAVFSRDDPRDVAIFNSDVMQKIADGQTLRIGTSSPRRALMAMQFLDQALPHVNGKQARVEAIPIRGNVDTRLRKVTLKQYDGVILAVAGLNRLLRYEPSSEIVTEQLREKRIMVLPLIECPPAPGQGALVAEAQPGNDKATKLIAALNDKSVEVATRSERIVASDYGAGCHQQFGVVHIDAEDVSFTYGAGVAKDGTSFHIYTPHPQIDTAGRSIFSAGDHMRSFFEYSYPKDSAVHIKSPALFIGSQHALHNEYLLHFAAEKRVWAAGTKTWIQLAKKGIWVEGCADAMGLEFVETCMSGPLIDLDRNDITILTDNESAGSWRDDGWKAQGTYSVKIGQSPELSKAISSADIIFWTSFRQYESYRKNLKSSVIHCCSTGKTLKLFRQAGISPVVFPGIKGFNEWRKQSNHTAATGE